MKAQEVLERARDALSVKRVFGEPYERDGVTIVPVATFAGGGGGGMDNKPEGGSGAGFGIGAKPAGVYVIRNGEVDWRPAIDFNKAMTLAVVALVVVRSILVKRAKARARIKSKRS